MPPSERTHPHRYTDTHIHTHTHTHTQIHRYTDTQIHKYTNTQIHRYTDTQIHRYTDAQIHTYTCRLHASLNTCDTSYVQRHTYALLAHLQPQWTRARTAIHTNTYTYIDNLPHTHTH